MYLWNNAVNHLFMRLYFHEFVCDVCRWKYDYLKGYRRSPWHRGIIGNLIELYRQTIDWKTVFETPAQLRQAELSAVKTDRPVSIE